MDENRAADLLRTERARLEQLLADGRTSRADDLEAAGEDGDESEPAQPLATEEVDDAISESFRDRLAAVERAEQRLRDHTYGQSVQSGAPIPDERLEADPAAELTVEEAAAQEAADRA